VSSTQKIKLGEFKRRFDRVKKKGWIKSLRRGSTGVGHTLQELLGIDEDNIALPDMHSAELKAHRIGSGSMITLFTFNRKAWKMKPLDAIRKYGTSDRNGRLGLYFTMSLKPNSQGLFLDKDSDSISVRHKSGEIIAVWQIIDLQEQFIKKFPALILVSAQTEDRGGVEWFQYTRARLLTGTSPSTLLSQIEDGNVLVDLRLHDKGTSARNHGTGFRTHEDRLPELFNNVIDL
jgi:MvaI/BcnI restriction endonuclease family